MSIDRGTTCIPSEIYRFLRHIVEYNFSCDETGIGEKQVPCIWGHAGLAKTSLVKQLGTYGIMVNGKKVFPKVTMVSLAQLEEAGDLAGLPEMASRQKVDQNGKLMTNKDGTPMMESYTAYAKPQWWPRDDGDFHILLIDDFNRASPSILKAIMQILQDYRSNVHDLPARTTVCLTGNPPDDGEYMVTEIDKAILTRMVHITIKFDKHDWASWAEKNHVDSRVLAYGLRYPEMIEGAGSIRTNPRSWVQFARIISPIKDLKSSEQQILVNQLANSALDGEAAASFLKFAIGDFHLLVEPEDLLNHYETSIKKLDALCAGKKPRLDLIGVTMDRLFVYLMKDDLKLKEEAKNNFAKLIQRNDLITEDMIYAFLRRLRMEAQNSGNGKDKFICDLVARGGTQLANLIYNAT